MTKDISIELFNNMRACYTRYSFLMKAFKKEHRIEVREIIVREMREKRMDWISANAKFKAHLARGFEEQKAQQDSYKRNAYLKVV